MEKVSIIGLDIAKSVFQAHELYKSLTWDNGGELADHQRFSIETDVDVYFCDPKSPWQRGSNENKTIGHRASAASHS